MWVLYFDGLMGQEDSFQDVWKVRPLFTPLANDTCRVKIWIGNENSDTNAGIYSIV